MTFEGRIEVDWGHTFTSRFKITNYKAILKVRKAQCTVWRSKRYKYKIKSSVTHLCFRGVVGYHVCLTRTRSWVRTSAETEIFCSFFSRFLGYFYDFHVFSPLFWYGLEISLVLLSQNTLFFVNQKMKCTWRRK